MSWLLRLFGGGDGADVTNSANYSNFSIYSNFSNSTASNASLLNASAPSSSFGLFSSPSSSSSSYVSPSISNGTIADEEGILASLTEFLTVVAAFSPKVLVYRLLSSLLLPFLVTLTCHLMPIYHAVIALRAEDLPAALRLLQYSVLVHLFLALDTPLVLMLMRLLSVGQWQAGAISLEAKYLVALAFAVGNFALPDFLFRKVLCPLHQKHEKDLDRALRSASGRVVAYVATNVKNVAWLLLFSPDGVVPYQSLVAAAKGSAPMLYLSGVWDSWGLGDSPTKAPAGGAAGAAGAEGKSGSNSSSGVGAGEAPSLGQRILMEAREVLQEGVVVRLDLLSGSNDYKNDNKSISGSVGEGLRFSMMTLNRSNELYLRIKSIKIKEKEQKGVVNDRMGSKSSSTNSSSSSNSSHLGNDGDSGFDLLVPLWSVRSVALSGLGDDSKDMEVILSRPLGLGIGRRLRSSSVGASGAGGGLAPAPAIITNMHVDEISFTVGVLLVSLSSVEDCDCFIAGIQALSYGAKKSVMAILSRAVGKLAQVADTANRNRSDKDKNADSAADLERDPQSLLREAFDKIKCCPPKTREM